MNEKIETQGKSVDDAINEALLRLGARRDEVDVTVLDEPKGGFLGLIGARPAKVEVTRKRSSRRGQRRDNKPGEGHDFGEGSGSSRRNRNSRNNRNGQGRNNTNRNERPNDHAAASNSDQGNSKNKNQNDNQQRRQGRGRNNEAGNERDNSRNNSRNNNQNNQRNNSRNNEMKTERNNPRNNSRSKGNENNRRNNRNNARNNEPNTERDAAVKNERGETRSGNRPESNSGRRPRNQRAHAPKQGQMETRPAQIQEQPVATPIPQQEVPVVETKRPRTVRRERPARKKPVTKSVTAQPREIEAPTVLTPLRKTSQGGGESRPRDNYQSQADQQAPRDNAPNQDRQSSDRGSERGGRNDRYNQRDRSNTRSSDNGYCRDRNEHRAARVMNSAPDEIIATGISAGKYAKAVRDIDLEKINDTLNEMTTGLLARAGFPAECDVSDGEYRQVRVTTGDESAGMLIGRHGATIDSVEHLVERMVSNAAGDRVRMNLDINEYRTRRHESLLERVSDAVTQIRDNGKTYHVEPMNARERRIVHLAVEEFNDMRTFTMDSHRGRHVVIALDRGENEESNSKSGVASNPSNELASDSHSDDGDSPHNAIEKNNFHSPEADDRP